MWRSRLIPTSEDSRAKGNEAHDDADHIYRCSADYKTVLSVKNSTTHTNTHTPVSLPPAVAQVVFHVVNRDGVPRCLDGLARVALELSHFQVELDGAYITHARYLLQHERTVLVPLIVIAYMETRVKHTPSMASPSSSLPLSDSLSHWTTSLLTAGATAQLRQDGGQQL